MSENIKKGENKLGSNPLGGALDWLDEEPAPPKPKRGAGRNAKPTRQKASTAATSPNAKPAPEAANEADRRSKGRGEAARAEAPAKTERARQTDSTRRGVAAGYRRHTVLMREDQIEQLDRLYALEKLHAGAEARTKKDLVEEAFDLFFESAGSNPRGVS